MTKNRLPEAWKVRCIAHRKNGEQCKKWAMQGQSVCGTHGGRAKQNLTKAKERIAMLADVAAQRVDALSKEARSEQVRFLATKDLLDRAKIGTGQELTVTVAKWEENMDDVFVSFDPTDDIVEAELVEDEPKAIPPSDWEYRTEVLTEKDSEPSLVRGNRKRGR